MLVLTSVHNEIYGLIARYRVFELPGSRRDAPYSYSIPIHHSVPPIWFDFLGDHRPNSQILGAFMRTLLHASILFCHYCRNLHEAEREQVTRQLRTLLDR